MALTSVTPLVFDAGDAATIVGTSFGASQGVGKVELVNNATYGSATVLVEQTVDSWSDTSIGITAVKGALDYGFAWLFVTDDGAELHGPIRVLLSPVRIPSLSVVAAGANVTSFEMTKPTGVASGDLMIAIIAKDDDDAITGVPEGWNDLQLTAAGTAARFNAYYKVAGGSEPSSYTWTGDSERYFGVILRLVGIRTPEIDISAIVEGNDLTPIAPSVDTVWPNALIIQAFGADDDDVPYTTPAGLIEVWNGNDVDTGGAGGVKLVSEMVGPGAAEPEPLRLPGVGGSR